jgi:hypothetical protein
LNVIVLVPCVDPKLVPFTVTDVPTGPAPGEILVILGPGVKLTPLEARPETVTVMFPAVAPTGTGTTIVVELQLVGAPAVPLNETVLVPCVAPKLLPEIVTDEPTAPETGDALVILGPGVKLTALLASPETVTTRLPAVAPCGTGTTILVALQLVGVPGVPLNLTVLEPWLAPKFTPEMVMAVPTAPELGAAVRLGPGVKLTPLLATPPTVTTMFPGVDPSGTGTTMLVELQLVGEAAVPLKLTVLDP